MIRPFLGLTACALASACTAAESEVSSVTPWLNAGPLTPLYTDDGATAAEYRGVWRSRGYGWVLEIDEQGVTRYQEGEVCYPTPEVPRQMSAMASVSYRYARALPGDAAIFQLLDGDTNVVFDRLDGLPDACSEPVDTTPTAVAAAFLDHFERHYAFFDRRLPDREARAERLLRTVQDGMNEAELWDALAAFMNGLSDSHTKLIGSVGGEPRRQQDGQGETLPGIRASMGEQSWLIGLIDQTMGALGETGVHTLNDRLVWGMLEPEPGRRVGYLQLFVMGGFTDRTDFASEAWADAEMAALNAALDEAFAAFDGADAVIVDLSNNRGGWDRVAKALPGRFTHQAFTGFTTVSEGSGLAPFPHVIAPADGPRFTGPVRLLTSDVTVSGGELATLAFRQLPNVTHYGGSTRGSFSTPPRQAPAQWLAAGAVQRSVRGARWRGVRGIRDRAGCGAGGLSRKRTGRRTLAGGDGCGVGGLRVSTTPECPTRRRSGAWPQMGERAMSPPVHGGSVPKGRGGRAPSPLRSFQDHLPRKRGRTPSWASGTAPAAPSPRPSPPIWERGGGPPRTAFTPSPLLGRERVGVRGGVSER